MTRNNKNSSTRKIINWILVSIAIILVCLIASKVYKIYRDNKLSESVLSRELGTVQINDVESSINELAGDSFILVSYVKNKEVKALESSIKKTILKNNLQNNFLYFDATELMLEDNYLDIINKKFSLDNKNSIKALPAILYYKDGKFVKTLSSSDKRMIKNDDFLKLLDSYEIIRN